MLWYGKSESSPQQQQDNATQQETPEAKSFQVRSASAPGTRHLRSRINNQDSYVVREIEVAGKQYTVGIVSDGCTGKKKKSRTEIGSGLLTMYAFSEIRMLLAMNVPLADIPKSLYPRCVSYVGNLARMTVAGTPQELCSFIENMFLCTLLGFVKDDKELVTFCSGDGFFIVNDQDVIIDQRDPQDGREKPGYLGYHQIDRSILGEYADKIPQAFRTNVYDLRFLDRFAVGTDGLVRRDHESGALCIDAEDRRSIFEYRAEAPAGLQWWLNKQQNRSGRFDDDTTLITLTKGESESEPCA